MSFISRQSRTGHTLETLLWQMKVRQIYKKTSAILLVASTPVPTCLDLTKLGIGISYVLHLGPILG